MAISPARRLTATLYGYAFLDDFVLLYPVYALLFADSGLTVWQISSLFALWSVTGVLLEIPSGAWADAVSRRLLLWVGPLLTAAGFTLWVLVPSYWAFALGFVLWGIKGALGSGALEALVYEEPRPARCGRPLRTCHGPGPCGGARGRDGGDGHGRAGLRVRRLSGRRGGQCAGLSADGRRRDPVPRAPGGGLRGHVRRGMGPAAAGRARRGPRGPVRTGRPAARTGRHRGVGRARRVHAPARPGHGGRRERRVALAVADLGGSDGRRPAGRSGAAAGQGWVRRDPGGLRAGARRGRGGADPGRDRPGRPRLLRVPTGERPGRRPASGEHRGNRPGHPDLRRRRGHRPGHRRRVRRLRGGRVGDLARHRLRAVGGALPPRGVDRRRREEEYGRGSAARTSDATARP